MRGLTPASVVPESSGGRTEEACIRPARLLEDATLAWHAVGTAEAWPGSLAFLDGVQRSVLLAYAGSAPLVVGEVAAAVRERQDRRLATVLEQRRLLLIARPEALGAAGELPPGLDTVALPTDEPAHPVRDLANAARALDRARGALELALGGDLSCPLRRLADRGRDAHREPGLGGRCAHAGRLQEPCDASLRWCDLERFLRVPLAHRTSIYAPKTRSLTPVHEWALRLWPWEGKDVFHGLVRIQVAPANGTPDTADALSRRILAERAPLSTPDHRWDRLLYGIHSVESYLRAGYRSLA